MDNRKVDICVTTFQRYQCTLECFIQVLNDPRVNSVVLVDDCSDIETFNKLKLLTEFSPKIRLYRNSINLDCYLNKHRAIELAEMQWVAIIDSDNVIDLDYLDKLYEIPEWDDKTSYMPSFAAPNFNYKDYEGVTLNKSNVAQYLDKPMLSTCLNCFNFLINRDEYLETFDASVNPFTSDSIYFNYCWFNRGNSMRIVKDLTYQHVISHDSHYKQHNHKAPGFYQEIENNLRNMR